MGRAWEEEDCIKILMGKPEGERPIGRPNQRGVESAGIAWLRIETGGGLV